MRRMVEEADLGEVKVVATGGFGRINYRKNSAGDKKTGDGKNPKGI